MRNRPNRPGGTKASNIVRELCADCARINAKIGGPDSAGIRSPDPEALLLFPVGICGIGSFKNVALSAFPPSDNSKTMHCRHFRLRIVQKRCTVSISGFGLFKKRCTVGIFCFGSLKNDVLSAFPASDLSKTMYCRHFRFRMAKNIALATFSASERRQTPYCRHLRHQTFQK